MTTYYTRCACAFALVAVLAASPRRSAASPPSIDPTFKMQARPYVVRASTAKRDASWIWASRTADNQTVWMRGVFSVSALPASAILYVTVDDFFTLFVNGKAVDATRPDPSDGNLWQHVHRHNIVELLHEGRNVIALHAQNAGGSAGAILRLEFDGKPALLTNKSWKVLDAPMPPPTWAHTEFDDSAWQAATEIAPLTGGPWGSAGGLDGWPGYNADAPYLAHLTIKPVAVLDVHPGVGSISWPHPGQSELVVKLAPRGSLDPPSLVVDFGKELAGRVAVQAMGAAAVVVGTGESREEAEQAPYGGAHKLEDIEGHNVATPYSAFRYAKLTFVPSADRETIQTYTSVTLDHKYYPVTYRGSFSCSDSELTRIWYTGAYTAHLCMQEDIWDAPKRDRARWMGDLHVSGEVINDVFADRFLMEQTMQRLRDDAQGGRPATAEPASHVNGIPGYSCAWICGLADFHRHIGDFDYLKRQHDLLISMLDYFHGELDERGLFANRRKAWPFVDWAPDFNGDGPLARKATHFFLIKAMREAVFLFHEMKDEASAERYSAWADQLTAAARQYLPLANTNTYSDRRQDNAMAIYSGVATAQQETAIYDTLLRPGSDAWKLVATPYYNNYVIYAMGMAGHTADTMKVLRTIWGGMLDEGATSFWEGYDPSWEKSDFHSHLQADNGTGFFVSLCHGWSAGPTSWLTDTVLGVQPTSGGFRTAAIVPDLGDLQWAEGDVPTPGGSIHVRVKREGTSKGVSIDLKLPAGVDAAIGLPGTHLHLNGKPVTGEPAPDGRVYYHVKSAGQYRLVSD